MSSVRLLCLVLSAFLGLVPTSAQTHRAAAALASFEGAVYLDDQPEQLDDFDRWSREQATVRR